MLGNYVNNLNIDFNPSGLVICMILGFTCRNSGVLPTESVIYDYVNSYFVNIGICCFLFGSNLFTILKSSRRMAAIFCLSASTVVVAVLITNQLLEMGDNQTKILAMLNASYIGGTANLLFMSKYMNVDNPLLMILLYTADNIVMGIYFVFIGIMSKKALRTHTIKKRDSLKKQLLQYTESIIYATLIFTTISIPASFFEISSASILVVLTIATITLSTFFDFLNKNVSYAHKTGTFIFCIFFCILGTQINISDISHDLKQLILCASFIVGIHFILLMLIGKLFNISFEELVVASNACVGGTCTVVPFIKTKNWHHLVEGATIMSIMGYTTANFISIILLRFL